MQEDFSIATFERLQAECLHDYMEPLLACHDLVVDSDDLAHLRLRLNEYGDQYHVVYSLLLLVRFDLDSVVGILPDYLQDEELSVCCVAYNAIQDLPPRHVTDEFLRRVKSSTDDPHRGPQIQALYGQLLSRGVSGNAMQEE